MRIRAHGYGLIGALVMAGCLPAGSAVGVAHLGVQPSVQVLNVLRGTPTSVSFPIRNDGYAATPVEMTVASPLLADTTTVKLEPGASADLAFTVVINDYESIETAVTLTSANEVLTVVVTITVEPDSDGDGYEARVTGGDDCDDADADVYPGAVETCDGVDEDCNDIIDDSDDARTWYFDGDFDSYGIDSDIVEDCRRPSGYAARGGDCDDALPNVFPGATESYYDGVDANCDDWSDFDADHDGFDAEAWGGADCADNDNQVHPDMVDTWYDGVDSDCDNHSDYDADDDGVDSDQHGGADCRDDDPSIHPFKPELLDGIDQDCDILVDETYFVDGDLIVTEIMIEPTAPHGQYVELMNVSPRRFEIVALRLETDSSDTTFTTAIMEAGDTRVWCQDDDPVVNGEVACDGILGGVISTGLFEVTVGGRVLDAVDTTGWSVPSSSALELSADAVDHEDNDVESAWCEPTGGLVNGDPGSPGEAPAGVCP